MPTSPPPCPSRRLPVALALALFAGLLLATVASAGLATVALAAPSYQSDFEERTIVGGLTQPTAVAWTPDGRMLVAEKAGRLKVVAPNGSTASTIYDFSGKVNEAADRGLLGLAVDSSFSSNRYVYLLYTYELDTSNPDQDGPMVSRLTRISLNANNTVSPETVLLGSYTGGLCPSPSNTVDCIPSEGHSHSIGTVRSAPDGTLYVGSGDASSFSMVDPLALRTLDERSMAGKVLRIDRNGKGLPGHPFCPAETDLSKVCTKVFAEGFRNPFRFTLRPNGGLAVGDVGWTDREEIDLIGSGGRSFGWPCYEGTTHTYGYRDLSQCATEYAKEGTAGADVLPQYDYLHNGGNNAIVGGPEYAGDQYPPSFRGSIFFGDYAAGFVKRLEVDAQGRVTAVRDFATGWAGVDLEATPSGDLAYVSFGDGTPGSGSVMRIVYSPGNRTPVARAAATPTEGPPPLTVAFDASGSTDPDGDALSYRWDFGDGQLGSGARPSHTYATAGTYPAQVTVDDGRGRSASTTVTIAVGSNRPVASIDAPVAGALFRVGDRVTLSGSATDAQDGALPASAFSWTVVLHHSEHVHPVAQATGLATTSFGTFADHDADSYYEITLQVTDSSGLTDKVTRIIRPELTSFGLDSSPAGAPVSYAGTAQSAPWTTFSAIGFQTSVSAAEQFTADGRTYEFDRWSDGGARVHDITIPATASRLTAVYRDITPTEIPGLAATQLPPPLAPPAPPKPTATKPKGPIVKVRPRRFRLSAKGVASLLVGCPTTATKTCTGTLKLKRADSATVARATFAVPAGRERRVRLAIPRRVRSSLKAGGLPVQAQASARDTVSTTAISKQTLRMLPAR